MSAEDASDLERFLVRMASETGTPVIGAEEADVVLDLARVVAHQVERRFAPLTAYVVGLALGPGLTPGQRAERAREAIAAVRRLAVAEDSAAAARPAGDGP